MISAVSNGGQALSMRRPITNSSSKQIFEGLFKRLSQILLIFASHCEIMAQKKPGMFHYNTNINPARNSDSNPAITRDHS